MQSCGSTFVPKSAMCCHSYLTSNTLLSPFNAFFLSPFFQDAVLALPVRGILLFLTPQLSPLLHVAIEIAPHAITARITQHRPCLFYVSFPIRWQVGTRAFFFFFLFCIFTCRTMPDNSEISKLLVALMNHNMLKTQQIVLF